MSYDIKMYDGETYDNKKKTKNKKRVADDWYVNTSDISNQIKKSDYNDLTSQDKLNYRKLTTDDWEGTEQENPIIADSANYVLYNPAVNNRHVYRGPYAFAIGYPLEVLGEKLASANQNSPKDYPSVQVIPSAWTYNKMTLANAPITGPALFNPMGLGGIAELWNMTAGVFVETHEMLGLYDDAIVSCPGAFVAPIENLNIFSKCVFNKSFHPYDPEFWESAWKSISREQFSLSLFSKIDNTRLTTNIFQWIASASGTWEHQDYNYFFSICGQPNNDILYAILNDKKPLKSQKYYEDIMASAPYEGQNDVVGANITSPFIRNQIWKRYSEPATENGKSKFNGLQYMLLYNAYKIAKIKFWNASIPGPNFYYNPRHASGSRQYIQIAVNVNSIGFDYFTSDTIVLGNKLYSFKFGSGIPRNNIDSIATGIAFPDYMNYGIRIPDVLSRNYNVGYRIVGNKSIPAILNVNFDLNISACVLTINKGIVKTTRPGVGEIYRRIKVINDGRIVLYPESRIEIADGTRLEIEQGSTLFYHPGARIILNGPNAILHIKGKLELAPAVLAGLIGTVLGAWFWYGVGRLVNEEQLERWLARRGRWLGIEPQALANSRRWFNRHGVAVVFWGRVIPGIRTLVSVPAGIELMPQRTFLFWTTAGSLLWVLLLTVMGTALGEGYQRVAGWIEPFADLIKVLIAIAVVLGALWLVARAVQSWRRSRR
jgi:membrane protein DedA with SNARE-associated domain